MIIDLQKFAEHERPFWQELESELARLESDPMRRMTLEQAKRFHYLYQRASSDLGKIMTFASEPQLRIYLESLVAHAYGEIHETRRRPHRVTPLRWFFRTFPQTFRKHAYAFWLSLAVMIVGMIFGGLALAFDSDAKAVLIPEHFGHLSGNPADRVAREERGTDTDRMEGEHSAFSAMLMTHNTKVSIFTLALGMTWGVGTIISLFYNGVILGAVSMDYMVNGQTKFLLGWLMPHGVIEIPAILIAGQAGLLLARALIGWADRTPLKARLRAVSPDLVTLIGGVAVMLVWAGIVEAFFSQYHEPIIPYAVKIAFGCVELVLLALFLSRSGRIEQKETSSQK